MYSQLAHLYDWPGSLAFATYALEKTRTVFDEEHIPADATILDLACGTGTLTLELAQNGFNVISMDLSEPMLQEAGRKAKLAGVLTEFIQGDMRQFTLKNPVDVVLCYYDSLNHLANADELVQAFQCVHQALKPEGLFLFDLNTLETYRELWQGRDVYEGPNYRLTIQSAFDQFNETGSAHFSAMEHTEEGLVCREETVPEKYFPDATVESLLEKTGFTAIQKEPFSPIDNPDLDFPLKTFWRCRKG